ncbi:MAG TPA: arginine deiminase family protein [Nitrososphaerales archaeon]|nr:arginine deiminase family protein [Nitrososphaerales archaeon]
MESEFDRHYKELQKRKWSLNDVPGYEKGKPFDIYKWQQMDYLDLYPKFFGRECGQNGIGKLREVALTKITSNEVNPLKDEDPEFWKYTAYFHEDPTNVPRWIEEQENYARVLKENGVKVHWIEFPDPPVSAFGPMVFMWSAASLFVLRGGSVMTRYGALPFSFGRSEWLARWAFINLGIPPLLTFTGKAACECSATVFLAEDVYVTCLSASFNREGLEQFIPVLKRSSGLGDDMHVQIMHLPGFKGYLDPQTGVCSHPDIIMGPLDVGKVIIYPQSIDAETHRWLRDNHYEIVEVGLKEHVSAFPCNLMLLEPGKVVMHAEAPEAIKAVRKLGVDVIEVPYREGARVSGGIHCGTSQILRSRGPFAKEIKK